jgi:hypothetical protein
LILDISYTKGKQKGKLIPLDTLGEEVEVKGVQKNGDET